MNAPASLQQWHESGEYEKLLGHRLFVQSAGSGPPLLLIHGFPTASWDWSWVWNALAAEHQLIAPDLLGFGFSDKPEGHRYSIAEQADLCEALLARRGIEQFDILAHDYGDTVAQELLARRNLGDGAAGLRSIMFLNGGLFPETHRPRLIQKLLLSPLGPWLARRMSRAQFGRSFSAIFGQHTRPADEELDAFWSLIEHNYGRQAMPRLLAYMSERKRFRARWVGALQRASVPIGLVNGVDDPVSGAHLADRFQQLLGDKAWLRRLPGIGHYPQVESASGVVRCWREFLQTCGAREEEANVSRDCH
jgi:pimeloyl-ACP methyl ester carboxylesterase